MEKRPSKTLSQLKTFTAWILKGKILAPILKLIAQRIKRSTSDGKRFGNPIGVIGGLLDVDSPKLTLLLAMRLLGKKYRVPAMFLRVSPIIYRNY